MNSSKLLKGMLIAFSVMSFVMLTIAQADPYFAIDEDEWTQALADGNVHAMDATEWGDYMNAWQYPSEGPPYPWTTFYPPQLYVYTPSSCDPNCCGPDFDVNGIVNFYDFAYFASQWLTVTYPSIEAPVMVMAWGPVPPGDRSASGWEYHYGDDPDLRDTTVEIEVQAPDCIMDVTFGFKDINGNLRAWVWRTEEQIPKNARTKLTITTDETGLSTANPVPLSTLSQGLFDISQVVSFYATEGANDVNVPPPGQVLIQPWNIWYNLVVGPNSLPPQAQYYKWRQPARYVMNQNNTWGWDEMSVNNTKPLLADDWTCRDDRRVTDINWWGSFVYKYNPNIEYKYPLPSVWKPAGFHIGIWTDYSPANVQNMLEYSHPKQMIWEHYCYNYTSTIAGYERDVKIPWYPIKGMCYKFSCHLPSPFVQDPNHNCLYWLSIAAIYTDPNALPPYVWGWKTRPHYNKDTAVRITSTVGGGWPPMLGSQWGGGTRIEYPLYYGWDLAFDLITDTNAPCPTF